MKKIFSILMIIGLVLGCTSCSEEEISDGITNVVNGAADAATKVDKELVSDAVESVIGTIGSSVLKGVGALIESADKEAVVEGISTIIKVVAEGTYDGVMQAIDVIKEKQIARGELSEEDVTELENLVGKAMQTLQKEYEAGNLTEEEFNERYEALKLVCGETGMEMPEQTHE